MDKAPLTFWQSLIKFRDFVQSDIAIRDQYNSDPESVFLRYGQDIMLAQKVLPLLLDAMPSEYKRVTIQSLITVLAIPCCIGIDDKKV